ncbi:hypothetical protein KPK_4752 [Klebsiella variicola]|uniref:Uncharacterized protein n=1 Tax=Klebsiella variicola (strain 342) TaxID=507522 RepID=B5Y252_KLEV3|nr:hypothetical protein KPK_4752 [Klebsiella variicola]
MSAHCFYCKLVSGLSSLQGISLDYLFYLLFHVGYIYIADFIMMRL